MLSIRVYTVFVGLPADSDLLTRHAAVLHYGNIIYFKNLLGL